MSARDATARAALAALDAIPSVALTTYPTPIEELTRLRTMLGGGPRVLIKRDDAIPFAFGGNKVRKLELVAARAIAAGADTLVTMGGVQSNHARVTAATAVRLGLRCVIVTNGARPAQATANAMLDELLGADVQDVPTRQDREPAALAVCERLAREGRKPYLIPIGASTPLGAVGFVRAVRELIDQRCEPDIIVHATSSGGTQAGLVAGCQLLALETRVVGVSADDPSDALRARVESVIQGIGELAGVDGKWLASRRPIEIDDAFVGEGYGIATAESCEAIELTARTEAIFLDPTYTAKAMAGLISYIRHGRFSKDQTVLFWHTGGQVGLFAR